jgi:FdhE protein
MTRDHWPGEAEVAAAGQEERSPETAPWLRLLRIALQAADDPAWRSAEIGLADARPEDAPVLHCARVRVSQGAAEWLRDRLLESPTSASSARSLSACALVAAGLGADHAELDRWARETGVDEGALATAAHFASLPVLLRAGAVAAERIPSPWTHGYCPVCAAWPTLVELRGLERRRVLRCGRCATGWERDVLHCPFCGERDHRRQGALVPEGEAELLRLETCDTCLGYIKAVTTLRPRPAWALPLDDLRTLELELLAVERGFRRPEATGWPLEVVVVPLGVVDTAAGGGTGR